MHQHIIECMRKAHKQGYDQGYAAALSFPYGSREPIAVEKGRIFRDETGSCDVAIEGWLEEGIEPQDCLVLILPADREGE